MADSCGGYDSYEFTAELYDYVGPYQERKDYLFFVDLAKECNGPVLELGCGTGRVLIPTAQAGIEITGLDLSKRMLAICRQKLLKLPISVRAKTQLIDGDMRSFKVGRKFNLITIPFRPFQHLISVKEQVACLNCAFEHLQRGGRIVVDIFNPLLTNLTDESRKKEFGDEAPFCMPDGRRVQRRTRTAAVDLFQQVLDCELIYYVTHPDGREERLVHAFQMRYLFRYEIEHLLTRCGFDLETVYSDYDRSPFGAKYPGELICVARKR